MDARRFTHTLFAPAAIFFLAVCGLGTKACQEDYELGAQTAGVNTTVTSTTGESTTSVTTTTQESTTTTTGASGVTTTTNEGEDIEFNAGRAALEDLENLTKKSAAGGAAGSGAKASNWLGKAYADEEVPGVFSDSDSDGYTDRLEEDSGSDANDPNSIPGAAPCTKIGDRFLGVDDDEDGVPNAQEAQRGMDAYSADSDSDGVRDGAEILSGSDPLIPQSKPFDSDGDGLSDEYETRAELDPHNADTDGDGLRDDLELALGTNPRSNDSDRDGILDFKEFQLGSDPTIPETVSGR